MRYFWRKLLSDLQSAPSDNPSVPTTLVIILWQFTVFQYKFDSPQVRFNITDFVYELPHNEVRLEKCQNWVKTKLSVQFSLQKWLFNDSGKKLRKNRYQIFCSCLIFLDLFPLCQTFFPSWFSKNVFSIYNLSHLPSNFNIFTFP